MFRDHGFGGSYSFSKPILLLCDPELVKQILTKDFGSFHDHGFPNDPENDPLSGNLFNVSGERWKKLRAKLSPTFTSGRIKGMFPLIHECVEELQECVRDESKKNSGSVEMLNLLMRYCADVIGTCAFGIKCNCLKNPDAEFHHMGREFLTTSFKSTLQFLVLTILPPMKKYVTTRRLFPKTTSFFTELMRTTVKYRRENKVVRPDFVQLMMQIADEETDKKFFNEDIMTAQAFLFFIAGLDSIATTVGHALHEMALNTDIQRDVHAEITNILAESDGKITYEAIKKMDLVSRVLDETMRKRSPNAFIMRQQTAATYQIPGTDVVLEKGTSVLIPVQAMQIDEKYFPNPEKFDPNRFTEEAESQRHPFTYLPFGEGPRFCIAARFAKFELRLCFVELVRRFEFDLAPETDLTLKPDNKNFTNSPISGFWLKVTERC